MFAMFEPKTLPIAVSVFPCNADAAATNISGAEDPTATMVKPIKKGGSPILRAKAAAPKTKRSELHIKSNKPPRSNEIFNSIEESYIYKKE
jgi:hypothetical protein